MSFILTLLDYPPYIDLPRSLAGILILGAGWLLALGIILYGLRRYREYNRPRDRSSLSWLVVLAVAVPITSLFVGLRLPAGAALPPPWLPEAPVGPALMAFAALPWVLAAGLLGPAAAAGLGGFSGLFLGLWDTHNPFTPLVFAGLGLLMSVAVRQRYRTLLFALLRRPFFVAILLSLVYPVLFLATATLAVDGLLANRLDFAITRLLQSSLAVAGMLLLAGLVAEVLAVGLPRRWGREDPLRPSPAEKSLQARFLYTVAPVAFVFTLLLMAGIWRVAENAARQILEERMTDSARMAADSVPYFLETGQSLIMKLAADERLYTSPPTQLKNVLSESLREVPFFTQLYLLDENGTPLTGHEQELYSGAPQAEQDGIRLALQGVPIQLFSVPPQTSNEAAKISFMSPVKDEDGQVQGVLIGRADLESNPFSVPIIDTLKSVSGGDGTGLLLDDEGMILYSPQVNQLMQPYPGRRSDQTEFYDSIAEDGTRTLVYYRPALGRPWAVVLSVPAQRAQQLALNIAAPLLGMILVLSLLSIGLLRIALGVVTSSLTRLSVQAENITRGELDTALQVNGEDEVAALSRAFENMRISLRDRLDELNHLLAASQGVASSLEIAEAVQPVLDSGLRAGACSARVVLTPQALPDLDGNTAHPTAYSLGVKTAHFQYLDEQILELTRQQERLVLTNPGRPRLLSFPPNAPRPEALLALPLRHENDFYGAYWLAYDRPHRFSDEEIRFHSTLAGQAAVAAANAYLFLHAEIGRQRLSAVLASTPDPVLVIDQQNRLMISNPAAWRVLGLGVEWEEGQPIERVIHQRDLLDLLNSTAGEKRSAEISLGEERVFYATASPVIADERPMGRVCILRDITYFKELDALKSEFVATVSHDLRSPLTLMRGYATMLEMVGELNEQQTNYVRRIVTGVESMSRLVTNLLDLGRIEAGIGLQVEMVPVHDVVERVVGALQLQAAQKKVQLSSHIPEQTIPLIEADQALLQQALQNLVENGIKYTEPGGQVQVRLATRPDCLVFEVSDTGVGIPPVDQPRLFEKFYRAGQNSKKPGGSGLGLAIVKSIAERHGGKVWVESQLGKGSTFYFSIPFRQPRKAA